MDAKELRIGNWIIIDDGFPERVTTVTFNIIHYFPEKESILKPILLTPEILEKAGFRLIDKSIPYYCLDYGKAFYFGCNCCDEYSFDLNVNYCSGQRSELDGVTPLRLDNIIHLHQLQNLYFTLIGEELQIEL